LSIVTVSENGGSLGRYDEATGESCQVTSNQIDNWPGGRCLTTPEPQSQEVKAFTEVLCKDHPDSDACKELIKGKQ